MDASNTILLKVRARELLTTCWNRRNEFWPQDISLNEFLLHAPKVIATRMLGLSLTEVAYIPNPEIFRGQAPSMEIAGLMDRARKQIIIAQKFGFVQGRFTLAHEIAHWLLHKGMVLHREMPMEFNSNVPKPPVERDANLFGAELLMPSRVVCEEFIARFKGIIDCRRRDEVPFYWLSQGDSRIDRARFFDVDPMYRAIKIADARRYHGRYITSMSEIFRVSAQAMAIQLKDLGLVK